MAVTAIRLTRIGPVQEGALWQELLESIHEENGDRFPGALVGSALTIEPGGEARAEELLQDAVNGCDDVGDVEYREALGAVLTRLRRARYASPEQIDATPKL